VGFQIHQIAVRARTGFSQLVAQQPLEIGTDGMFHLFGFVVNAIPLHSKDLRQHSFDQVMTNQQPV